MYGSVGFLGLSCCFIFHYQHTVNAQQAHDAKNDVILTSMRHDDVASTSVRRYFDVMCPLGEHIVVILLP